MIGKGETHACGRKVGLRCSTNSNGTGVAWDGVVVVDNQLLCTRDPVLRGAIESRLRKYLLLGNGTQSVKRCTRQLQCKEVHAT